MSSGGGRQSATSSRRRRSGSTRWRRRLLDIADADAAEVPARLAFETWPEGRYRPSNQPTHMSGWSPGELTY